MDEAYTRHSHHSKRNGRSTTNLSHLSLAPLTSRIPFNDVDSFPEPLEPRSAHEHRTSYLEGRSAPTTPRLLSRSNSRVSLRKTRTEGGLLKSKSSTHITLPVKSGEALPTSKARKRADREGLTLSTFSAKDRNDSDWLLRAGALLSSETRESKGQAWLVSRASSTSLTGEGDEEDEALEKELTKERESRRNSMSRRGSLAGGDADDEYSPMITRMSFGGRSRSGSRFGSRTGSRIHSRRGSKALFTPLTGKEKDKERDDYFDQNKEFIAEPDFVDVDEEVYDEDQAAEDDVIIRKLTRNGSMGLGYWVESLIGWNLFSVDEDGDETDNETAEPMTDTSEKSGSAAPRRRDVVLEDVDVKKMPPPQNDEGTWQDAAWLLSVATKVLL